MVNSRTPDMDCLLCKVNKATQTNSHIVPEFIGKSMFGNQNPRKVYDFDSEKLDHRTHEEGDTPRENYILCPSCEQYFSVIETYISNNLYNNLWREKLKGIDKIYLNDEVWKIYKGVNPKIFHLFFYSIVWRCSISNHLFFKNFKLEPWEEDKLSEVLRKYNFCTRKRDLDKIIDDADVEFLYYNFSIITAEHFPNCEENIYFVCPQKSQDAYYYFLFNELFIKFSFIPCVASLISVTIRFLKIDMWRSNNIWPIFKNDAQILQKFKNDTGRLPWILREENIGFYNRR